MHLHGQNLIGFSTFNQGDTSYRGVDPAKEEELGTAFADATEAKVNQAAQLAAQAVETYKHATLEQRSSFLEAIAEGLEAGHGEPVRVRCDSGWNVPEPELVLVLNAGLEPVDYCAGNDVSSRDIEGENPLYLPQAKVYNGACALGPGIQVADKGLGDLSISLTISRQGEVVFEDEASTAQMKRSFAELAACLSRELSFWREGAVRSARAALHQEEVGLRCRDVLTEARVRNAMVVHAAFGSSTNLLLHVPAIAYAVGLPRPAAQDWLEVGRATPRLVSVLPNGPAHHPTVRVFLAGGVPEVMLHLRGLGLLELTALTATGRPLGEMLDVWEASERRQRFKEVLREKDGVNSDGVIFSPRGAAARGMSGTISILTGNLAPDGAVVKSAAIDLELFGADGIYRNEGPARVFTREYNAIRAIKEGTARAALTWLTERGMCFDYGADNSDAATDLTEAQVLEQLKMYVAATRTAFDFGCDAVGIQYQQGLKDLVPASDLTGGLLNNVERPPVHHAETGEELYAGRALPHFYEVDEGAAVDALVTHRVWSALGFDPATTLHDLRWGEHYTGEGLDDFIWTFQISGALPASHLARGYADATSHRQPPMYFPLGGGTLSDVSKPGEIVWSRVYLEGGKLHVDLGRGSAVTLLDEETTRRREATTSQWPIIHAVLHGVSRDQMMARHKANHIQVAYAPSAEAANRALTAKAAMFAALGLDVHLCGTHNLVSADG